MPRYFLQMKITPQMNLNLDKELPDLIHNRNKQDGYR